uniref:F-box domain-containing protein n=1 Tax=Oryza punctata TaxID=4537 RepID=A0A0E0KMP8_ORYPU
MPPPSPSLRDLSDELVGEILVRLPPDDPACLLRASLACKAWRRILADRALRRRLHRTPPVVGFLRIGMGEGGERYGSRYTPNNGAAAATDGDRDLPLWLVVDCRHGRALFATPCPRPGAGATSLGYDFIVWDPFTNEHRRLPWPSPPPDITGRDFNAAVLCAGAGCGGCDHRSCHGGPFRVALIWSRSPSLFLPGATSARVYSSETGEWSETTTVEHHDVLYLEDRSPLPCRSVLVGDTLYFTWSSTHAFELRLGAQRRLSIVYGPPRPPPLIESSSPIFMMSMDDGVLRCIDVEPEDEKLCLRLRLRLWSRNADGDDDDDGVAGWISGRAIELEPLLPDGALQTPWIPSSVQLLGAVEGTDVIFVGTHSPDHPAAVYMVQLNSRKARKVFDKCTSVVPYTSFCIPGIDDASTREGATEGASSA